MKCFSTLHFLFVVLLSAKIFAEPFDYCKSFCSNKKQNVACGCKLENPACEVEEHKLGHFRQIMVDVHNQLRNKFASGGESYADNMTAANMHVFNYDLGLEYTASCQSKKCVHAHDGCHATEKFKTAGQNLFWSSVVYDQPKQFEHSVTAWYDEVSMLKLGSTDANMIDAFYSIKGTGHFTQIIWAKTTNIGCSRVWDPTSKKWMLTCNYGPAGNFIGMKMFIKGASCSSCESEQCNSKYTGLCGKLEAVPGDSVGLGSQDYLVPQIFMFFFTLIVVSIQL